MKIGIDVWLGGMVVFLVGFCGWCLLWKDGEIRVLILGLVVRWMLVGFSVRVYSVCGRGV